MLVILLVLWLCFWLCDVVFWRYLWRDLGVVCGFIFAIGYYNLFFLVVVYFRCVFFTILPLRDVGNFARILVVFSVVFSVV